MNDRFSLVSDRPQLTADDVNAVLHTAYGIDGRLDRLPSERDQNFRVLVDRSPRYVAKVSNGTEQRAVLELQHAAMRHLSEAGLGCPVVVPAHDGETLLLIEGHLFSVLTFLPGDLLAHRQQRSPALLNDFGRFLGRMTRSLAGFEHPGAVRHLQWDVQRSGAVVSRYLDDVTPDHRPLVERALRAYESIVTPAFTTLPHSVIHNDANDHNVLVEGDRVSGIIDFGDMVHSLTLNELAVGCAYAMLGQPDPLLVRRMVTRGYEAVLPLSTAESGLLPELVRTRLATSVAISAHQHALEPHNAYLTVSENHAWRVLEILDHELEGKQR